MGDDPSHVGIFTSTNFSEPPRGWGSAFCRKKYFWPIGLLKPLTIVRNYLLCLVRVVSNFFFFFCTILSFADYSIKAMASLVGTSVHVSSTLLRTALFLFGDKKKTCEPARPKLPTSFLVGRVVGRFPEVPIIQLIGFPYCKEGLSACRLANQLTSPADFPTIVS